MPNGPRERAVPRGEPGSLVDTRVCVRDWLRDDLRQCVRRECIMYVAQFACVHTEGASVSLRRMHAMDGALLRG